jgi:predicted RNase H-like HicB family nuclease
MSYRLAVEDIEPNHWIAWVLDLPACFSSAKTETEAVTRAPERIAAYFAWLTGHAPSLPEVNVLFDVEVVETFRAYTNSEDPEYIVNAFFEDDRRPLTYWDIEVVLRLLQWTRLDLWNVLDSAGSVQLQHVLAGEVHGSILGVVEHVAGVENWYLGHLDLDLQQVQLPTDQLERLQAVRANTREKLGDLIGIERITENSGELWSARKVVRRTLWHERDHTQHIVQLISELEGEESV